MSQHDLNLANANGANFRTDVNLALLALGQTQSGTAAPSPSGGLVLGNFWIDTTSSPYRLKFYNGTTWIEVLNFTSGGSPTVTVAGVGTIVQGYDANTAKLNVVGPWTKQQYFNAAGASATLTDGATINWNMDDAQVARVTLGGNRTMAAPTNIKNGGAYILHVKQDATGGRTLAWNSSFKFVGSTPVISTAANAVDVFTFVSDDATNLRCIGLTQGF